MTVPQTKQYLSQVHIFFYDNKCLSLDKATYVGNRILTSAA